MAKRMNTKAELQISTKEAIEQIENFAVKLKELKANLGKDSNAIAIKVTINGNSLRSIKKQLKDALGSVNFTLPTISNTKSSTTPQDVRKTTREAKQATQEVVQSERQAINSLTSIVAQSGAAMKNATSIGTAQITQMMNQIVKAERAAEAFRQSLNFTYPGGAAQFDLDIDEAARVGVDRFTDGSMLPALVQAREITRMMGGDLAEFVEQAEEVYGEVQKIGGALGEWDEVLEGEVIDEWEDLRDVVYDTDQVIIDGMIDNSAAVKKFGKSITSLGSTISKLGTKVKQLGNAWSNFSTKGLQVLSSMGQTAMKVFNLFGSAPQEAFSGAVEQIKDLEFAMTGLRNQFSTKELGFDVEKYVENLKDTARKTMGVGVADLATYTNQLAPISSNSQQAYDVTMGLLKTITYGGGDPSSEMGYMIKNIRDVLAKGQAYAMDINQFNRAAPVLRDILKEMGLTQFIKDDNLSITKENVGEVMEAFAKLNDESSPVYGILDEMNQTLGGLMEEAQETLQQSVADALESSGLLDTWKGLLQNEKIWDNITKALNEAANAINSVLKQLDGNRILDAIIKFVTELGTMAKETLLPAIKRALGLSEEASLTDTLIKGIELFTNFIKGVIEGLSYIFGTVVPKIKSVVEGFLSVFGIKGEDAMKMLGWLVGTGWALGKIFGTLGSTVMKFVGWVLKLIGNHFITNAASAVGTTGGGNGVGSLLSGIGQMFSNSKIGGKITSAVSGVGSKITGGLSSITGTQITGATLLKGLGITAAGHLLSESLSDWVSQGNAFVKDVTKSGTDLLSTFIGVSTAINPAVGLFAAFVEGLAKVNTAMNELDTARKEAREQTRENSLNELQNTYVETVKDSLRNAGLFEYENDDAEDALVEMIAAAQNITADQNPEEVLRMLRDTYMSRYSRNLTASDVEQFLEDLDNKDSANYVAGSTRMTKDYANTEEGQRKLKEVQQRLADLGMIDPASLENIISDYNGGELWAWLKKQGYDIQSVEYLNALHGKLTGSTAAQQALEDQKNDLRYGRNQYDEEGNITGFKFYDDMTQLMTAMGFTQGTEGTWVNKAEFNVEIEEGAQAGMQAQLREAFTVPGLLDENGNLIVTPVLNTDQKTKDDFKKQLYSLYDWSMEDGKLVPQWKGAPYLTPEQLVQQWETSNRNPFATKANGGFIRPIFREGGGGTKLGRGVDTVPAMLSPGEFVQRASAVAKAGMGVMTALNHGDLAQAYRLLGTRIRGTHNTYNNRSVSNSSTQNQRNDVIINNYNSSAHANAYRGLKNLMSLH